MKNSCNSRKIDTAFIACGGYGTRFLPFTKIVPKELLPVSEKPLIHLLVDECIEAGIKKIYVVYRSELTKRYFEQNEAYSLHLKKLKKKHLIKTINFKNKYSCVQFIKINDELPYGNTQGLLTIKKFLQKANKFLLCWGDDIVIGRQSSIKSILQKYENSDCDFVLNVQKMGFPDITNFGNIGIRKGTKNIMERLVQKPQSKKESISDLALIGQMIFTKEIFLYIKKAKWTGEPDLGLVLNDLAKDFKIIVNKVGGKWITVGDPEQYLKGLISYKIIHNRKYASELNNFIESLKKVWKQ